MSEETRANLGMAFFVLFFIGMMSAVVYWDMAICHKPEAAAPKAQQERGELEVVITPIVEPPANCLPFEDDPPLIEDLNGLEFDYDPEHWSYQ